MADQITTKPFVSQAQAGFAFATNQPWAKRWARQTGPYKKLPKRIKRKVCPACVLATVKERLAPGVSRIRGDLCNVHGRWGSCRAAGYGGAASPRVAPKQLPKAPKARAGRRGGGGKGRAPAKPKPTPEQRAAQHQAEQTKNRQAVDKALGLPEDAAGALDDLRAGKLVDDDGGLVKMGLAEQAADGSYRLTPAGRALDAARAAGDTGRARDIMSSARDRKAGHDERTAATAERKRQAAAARAKRGRGGKGKKQPKPATAGAAGLPRTSSRVPQARGGAKLPKAPKPAPPKKPAPAGAGSAKKPELPAYLVDAVRALSVGATLSAGQYAALLRNGLATQRRDGRWVLTGAGRRAAIAAGAEPAPGVGATPAPLPPRRTARRVRGRRPPRRPAPAPPRRTKAHDGPHHGVMVALYPDARARQALAGADGVTEDAADLHLTLCYLGKTSERPLATNKDRLVTAVADWARAHGTPLQGTVNGVGRFTTVEDDGANAVYASPDVPGLAELRQSLIQAIEQAGFDYSAQHDFTPHITVAYVPKDAPTPQIAIDTPVRFDHVTLAWGDEHHNTPLGYPDQSQFAGHTMEDWDDTRPDSFYKAKSFAVFKDASGQYRWIARTTTAYRDRDDEIISVKALEEDAARMTATGMYGPLRFWHVGTPDPLDPVAPWGPGLDIGDCDFSIVIGRTNIESGTFTNEAIGRAYAETADEHELSPGFFYARKDRDAARVFHRTRRFERSTVPTQHGRASNLYTGLTVKEHRMDQATYDQRVKAYLDFARAHGIPPEAAAAPLVQAERADKDAAERKIAYKEAAPPADLFRAFLTDPPPAAPATVAATKAETPPADPPAVEADPIAARFKALEDQIAQQAAEIAALKAPPPMDGAAGDAETPMEEPGEMGDDGGDAGLTLSQDDLMAIAQVVGQGVATALEPLIGALGITTKLEGHLGELKSMMGGIVKQKDDTQAQQAQELASLKGQLAELTGDAPRGGGYRASQAADTTALGVLAAAMKDGPPSADGGVHMDAGPFADQLVHWFPHLAQQPGQQR